MAKPTLSGLGLSDESQRDLDDLLKVMARAGKIPPKHVQMMLEVIAHETDLHQKALDDDAAIFANSPLLKQSIRMRPATMGSDFEFVLHAVDEQHAARAQAVLDGMVLERLKAEFRDVPGVETLELDTIKAFMEEYRKIGVGNAHEFRANEVLKPFMAHMEISSKQVSIMRKLCDTEHRERTEQIAANHLYPGDLLLQIVEAKDKASGQKSFQTDWPPYKRHESVSDRVARMMPQLAKSGRFEVATPHENASPLRMLKHYYETQAKLDEVAAEVKSKYGIEFHPVQRMTDHVHISDEKDMLITSDAGIKKAAGVVHVAEAMAPVLADESAFGRGESSSGNWIQVKNFGYATDNQYAFHEQRRFAVRGVEESAERGVRMGHLELRMGDSRDPFGIVYQTAAAIGGLNKAKRLDPKLVAHTARQYHDKAPGKDIATIELTDAKKRFMEDPLTDFIPPAVKKAVLAGRETEKKAGFDDVLPRLDTAAAVPATQQALDHQSLGAKKT